MQFRQRTHKCGELREIHIGKNVILNGWISRIRDLGGLIFIDLRDRWGIAQLVILPETHPHLAEKAKELHSEYVIWAAGSIRSRENPNPNIPTGFIEVLLDDFEVINKSELPPFEIIDDLQTSEEIRLKYRYLDLRRPSLQKNLITRHRVYQIIHQYFDENEFVEIETPVLMKSTPEGARDFLVPSRLNKGKFYALPQSPQIFKQILMISGFDRYVQIVKCFRDEDLRSDRQPEFTQIDLEMSFIKREDIFSLIEGLMKRLWKEILNIDIITPFQKIKYEYAMNTFGSDKPDLRFGLEIKDITEIVKNSGFKVFTDTFNKNGKIALINAKKCGNFSRKQIDELQDFTKKYGAKGLATIKYQNGEIFSPIAKFLNEAEINQIFEIAEVEENDLLLIIADEKHKCLSALGALRLEIARRTGILYNLENIYNFCWIIDFPLFEWDSTENRLSPMHHPFTSPNIEDLQLLDTDPLKVRAYAYDLVINGAEIGGGSIRIYDNEIQQKIFKLLGLGEDDANEKFGFLLDALRYGAPPHGGIALGLDRLVMTLVGTENIRNVIAFPKTTSGLSLMDGSPSFVDKKQLDELGIQLIKE